MSQINSVDRKKKTNKKKYDLTEIENFFSTIEGLTYKPSVHVNGREHSMCIVVIDWGVPLDYCKISQEDSDQLYQHLRTLTKQVVGHDRIRVSHDGINGIYWSSVE